MREQYFTQQDIKKFGVQVVMIPVLEAGTDELRYRIVGICNGNQMKLAETGKPITAISELKNYFVKYSTKVNKIGELAVKKIDEEVMGIEEIEKELNNRIKKVNEIPSRDELRKLSMKGEKSLMNYCKEFGIKGYSKVGKDELINLIMDRYIEELKKI
jgi:hypothetical protein